MSNHAKRGKRMVAGMLAGALALSVTPILGFTGVASAADPLPPVADPIGAGNVCEGAPTTEPFTDVQPDDPSYEEIVCLVATGLTRGTTPTTYSPNGTITRRQMAAFIKRLADELNANEITDLEELPAYDGTPDFDDILDEDQEFQVAIGQLVQAGIVEGVTPDEYRPGAPVSRRQMAAFINRLHDFLTGAPFGSTGDFFDDDNGDTGEDNLNALAAEGIFQGNGQGSVFPGSALTRRQMANILLRYAQVLFEDGDITGFFTADTPGAVTVNPTTIPRGGAVTGTVSGAVQSLSVSGCGLTNQAIGVTGATNAFTFNLPQSQAAGTCVLTFTITRPGGATETQTVTITVTAPPTFTLGSPIATQVNPASTPANPDQGRENYTFTFPAGFAGPVDITLVPAGNVRQSSAGATAIEFADADDNGRADDLGQCGAADIELVDGVDPTGGTTQYINNQAIPADRTLDVTIDSTQPGDACIVLVFRDTNNDNQLGLNQTVGGDTDTDGVPTEPFGIAGIKLWFSSEAPFGADTVNVATKGDLIAGDANNLFLSTTAVCPTANATDTAVIGTSGDVAPATPNGTRFDYDANDVFQIDGVGTTLENFERLLGTCDQVVVSYNPDPAGVSTFNLISEVNYLAPSQAGDPANIPVFTAINADNGTTANDVRVTFVAPPLNNADAQYEIQRANTAGPDAVCGTADDLNAASATFETVLTVTEIPGDSVSRTISNNPNGCFLYRVEVTNPVTGNNSRSVPQALNVPGAADVGAPRIVQSTADDAGLPGRLDSGDRIFLLFSEAVNLANGDSIVVEDGDGEEFVIVLGTGNTFTEAARGTQELLTITLTATPAGPFVDRDAVANNDGVIEFNETFQAQTGLLITNSQGITDAEGNSLGIPANTSDRVIEADEVAGGTAGDDDGAPFVRDVDDVSGDGSAPDPTDNAFIVCFSEAIDAASAADFGDPGPNQGTILGGGSYTVTDGPGGTVNPVTNVALVPTGLTDPDLLLDNTALLDVPNPQNVAHFAPIAYSANATCVRVTTLNTLGDDARLTTVVRDLAGNASTEVNFDVTDPVIVANPGPTFTVTDPAETGVDNSVTFFASEVLNPATVDTNPAGGFDDFQFINANGGVETITSVSLQPDNRTIIVTLNGILEEDDTVRLLANSVADPGGATGPPANVDAVTDDTIRPTVAGVIADDSADGIIIGFSENMDCATVDTTPPIDADVLVTVNGTGRALTFIGCGGGLLAYGVVGGFSALDAVDITVIDNSITDLDGNGVVGQFFNNVPVTP